MSKGQTTKEALKVWASQSGQSPAEATTIKMLMYQPFITKMDNALSDCSKCAKLLLSTNQIEKMTGLSGMQSLQTLSLGRNLIKKIEGLDSLTSLTNLWISYNFIEKLNGIENLKELQVLYASNNKIKAWDGMQAMKDLTKLEEVEFTGNPIEEKHREEGNWRELLKQNFPQVKKLDGKMIIVEDVADGDPVD